MELIAHQLASQGYAWLRGFMKAEQCAQFKQQLAALPFAARRGGVRHIERQLESVTRLAFSGEVARLAQQYCGANARFVRAIWFDKSAAQNWLVAWHQDITVTANERFAAPDWGPWSEKEGVLHVQAPLDVLQSMLTVRLHLDCANAHNGALKIIPGSHLGGIERGGFSLDPEEIVICDAQAGDVLLMSPLLWHASSKASQPQSRQFCILNTPSI
ncbi:phytanoyl-CoA dioxygenase family protein [Chitinibacter sp. GC72]|uniref:phytanoyl-CoA dioxygenase family protein n=1 Tax=Chitinibacter sp. GC72 TaxID=1526917 RepID=UPI0012FB19DC|nr:phytanoyl-CoA dioxygenase family protein [Chitinibacter sp. GC72]